MFNTKNVTVGKQTYGELNINLGINLLHKIEIGNFCSIAPNVNFIINPHNYKFFSTWGWQRFEYNEFKYGWERKTNIVVVDAMWIGQDSTILGGTVLHQGCVDVAGSIVSGEVPVYAIYVGNRVIKYRFWQDVCEKLLRIDYKQIYEEMIARIRGWHKIEIDETNVDQLLEILPLKKQKENI